jgi:hypothetical protein
MGTAAAGAATVAAAASQPGKEHATAAAAAAGLGSHAAAVAPLALAGVLTLLWLARPAVFWAPCPILSLLLQP